MGWNPWACGGPKGEEARPRRSASAPPTAPARSSPTAVFLRTWSSGWREGCCKGLRWPWPRPAPPGPRPPRPRPRHLRHDRSSACGPGWPTTRSIDRPTPAIDPYSLQPVSAAGPPSHDHGVALKEGRVKLSAVVVTWPSRPAQHPSRICRPAGLPCFRAGSSSSAKPAVTVLGNDHLRDDGAAAIDNRSTALHAHTTPGLHPFPNNPLGAPPSGDVPVRSAPYRRAYDRAG
jgi:hypothetical protein